MYGKLSLVFQNSLVRNRGSSFRTYCVIAILGNVHLTTDERDFEKVSEFKYLEALITENNKVGKEVKHRRNLGNACCYSVQGLLSSRILSRNFKLKMYSLKP